MRSREEWWRLIQADPVEAYDRATGTGTVALAKLPRRMQESVAGYVILGNPLGGFLTSVFADRFLDAVRRADEVNRELLAEYADFVLLAPPGCHGSLERVVKWIDRQGLHGISTEPRAEATE